MAQLPPTSNPRKIPTTGGKDQFQCFPPLLITSGQVKLISGFAKSD